MTGLTGSGGTVRDMSDTIHATEHDDGTVTIDKAEFVSTMKQMHAGNAVLAALRETADRLTEGLMASWTLVSELYDLCGRTPEDDRELGEFKDMLRGRLTTFTTSQQTIINALITQMQAPKQRDDPDGRPGKE